MPKKNFLAYPLVELAVGLLFFVDFSSGFFSVRNSFYSSQRDWLLIAALVIIFVYDFRWQLIPMTVIWPLIVVIFILNLTLGLPFFTLLFFTNPGRRLFLVQYLATKKRGVAKGYLAGALLGASFPTFDKIILDYDHFLQSRSDSQPNPDEIDKKNWQSRIALGPFLALAAIITLLWGSLIINWYWNLPLPFLG